MESGTYTRPVLLLSVSSFESEDALSGVGLLEAG